MFAGAASIALGLLFVVFLGIGVLIYLALGWQIARRAKVPAEAVITGKTFGLPEAFVAVLLILFFLMNIALSYGHSPIQLTNRDLMVNFLLTVFIVLLVAAVLKFRGIDIESLGGFSKMSLKRALSMGVMLILAATPLILLAEAITQNSFGGGSSRQEIVDLFSTSRTLEQRVLIIVLAIVVAPISEEFIFRFFIYGVVRRYFGIALGLFFSATLFAAAHNHLPSALPLFVLGACFTLAYEWSGSILVSMSMHALFNASQLTLLAFPDIFQQ